MPTAPVATCWNPQQPAGCFLRARAAELQISLGENFGSECSSRRTLELPMRNVPFEEVSAQRFD